MPTYGVERPIYAWGWLPGTTEPVLIGAAQYRFGVTRFRYSPGYLDRPDAISLWPDELPLHGDWIEPALGSKTASVLLDSGPDAWGKRVIVDRTSGRAALQVADFDDDLFFLREATSDRIGALDWQDSPTQYVPRGGSVALEVAEEAAVRLDQGQKVPPEVRAALDSGTGVGGAQPKAFVTVDSRPYLAKFSTSTDDAVVPPISAEAAAMVMARAAGLEITDCRVLRVNGRRALLMDRFDRTPAGGRRMVLTGVTITGAPPRSVMPGSYLDLLAGLRRYANPGVDVGEALFRRVAFSMAITNTDDHLRNHAAFWDGHTLTLTPAYDLAPGPRSGDTATLATGFDLSGSRLMRFPWLVDAAPHYGLSRTRGAEVIDEVKAAMHDSWPEAADQAMLSSAERERLWGRQFLHESLEYDS